MPTDRPIDPFGIEAEEIFRRAANNWRAREILHPTPTVTITGRSHTILRRIVRTIAQKGGTHRG